MIARLTQLGEDWLDRIREADPIDLWAENVAVAVEEEPFQRDEAFLESLLELMKLWNAWFDSEVRGLERVPDGEVLVVGNHSGGVITPDTSALWVAWHEHFGMERPLVGLALDTAFTIPGLRTILRKMGEVPASMENAGRALAGGASVLVYPGGDWDVFRPWSDRNKIDFGGRKGFVRLALRQGVPVVPVVGHGGHDTLVVLTRGEAVAQMIRSKRLRMEVMPLAWGLPWGLYPGTLPNIPIPSKVTVEACEPLDWSGYGPEGADDPDVVARCYDEITDVMQSKLTALAEEDPWPVITRLRTLGEDAAAEALKLPASAVGAVGEIVEGVGQRLQRIARGLRPRDLRKP